MIFLYNSSRRCMDKRTAIFVVALSAALFLVNFYFQRQHEDSLRVWNEQQAAKQEQKLNQLNREIETHTVAPSEFPLVELFRDGEGKESLGQGLLDEQNVLTFGSALPEVYVSAKGNFQKYTLSDSKLPSSLQLYQSEDKKPLAIGELPGFGEYDVQLLSLQPPKTLLGRFTDGHFTVLADQTSELAEKPVTPLQGPSLALIKIER